MTYKATRYAKRLDSVVKEVSHVAENMFVVGDVNSIGDRRATGLGDCLVDFYSDIFSEIFASLNGSSISGIASVFSSKESHVLERVCAGNILNMLGYDFVRVVPDFVSIPAGCFFQGTDEDDVDRIWQKYSRFGVERKWIEKEVPKHKKNVEAFNLSTHPITNKQYRQFLLETETPGVPNGWFRGNYPFYLSNHPVYGVSLNNIKLYCSWLASKTGENVRLPTETEWEYVAGNGKSLQYSWGDEFLPFMANTNEVLLQMTSPVGAFLESDNQWGVSDLIGNVEEFVSDCYYPYCGGEVVKDDLYLRLGEYRIAKGGAFNRFADLARVQRRHGAYPSSLYAIGFRVAYS